MDPCRVPKVMFMNGNRIPIIGFGTYEVTSTARMRQAVMDGIDAGYRHVDCAMIYKNEEEVGEGLCEKFIQYKVTREDLFITGKLWNTFHSPDLVCDAYDISLKDLKLQYLDMYLMNWPTSYAECEGLQPIDKKTRKIKYGTTPFETTWREMEKMIEKQLTKNVGVSNFNCRQMEKLIKSARTRPVVNQVECHPYLPQHDLKDFCESYGVLVSAYAPLGSAVDNEYRSDEPVLLEDATVGEIANKHGKTPAQILLRFQVQRGVIPVVKSTCKEHIESNIKIWDFYLDQDDMKQLECLGKTVRYHSYYWIEDHPDYPFKDKF